MVLPRTKPARAAAAAIGVKGAEPQVTASALRQSATLSYWAG
jgi:hypothetical protein